MWQRLSSFILRYRVLLLILITLFTIFMGYTGRKVEMSYEFAELLPDKDQAKIDQDKLVADFGEEANIIAIAITDTSFWDFAHYKKWEELCNTLKDVEAVNNFLSIPNSYQLVKNTDQKSFELSTIFPENVNSQEELDSLRSVFENIPLYNGYLYNDTSYAYLAILTMDHSRMIKKEREGLVENIVDICEKFEKESGITIRYSGLPYIQVRNSTLIKREIFLFTGLALAVTLLILYLFFKSFRVMFYSALVVLSGVATSIGTIALFGYKITILTGMVPPLLIVIGIPNCIYILNKYHNEYRYHKNQIKALKRVIMKIGNAIFLTNLTTASGFATFITTNSAILKEFGIIASVNIVFLFILSIILIPTIFSFQKPPAERHMKHLKRKTLGSIIERLVSITENHRTKVYVAMVLVLVASIFGMTKMRTTGFLMDDIPENDPVKQDLLFFENNFDGIMPIEIIIDTKKPNGIIQTSNMRKIDKLGDKLEEYHELSKPLSYISIIKMAKQAFYNGSIKHHSIPSSTEKNFLLSYVGNSGGNLSIAKAYIDSTQSKCRVSFRVKDIGTQKMDSLYSRVQDEVHQYFPPDKYDTTVTGSMVVFFKGNQYLVGNLITSLALAVSLIAIFMAAMFRSKRMVMMSLVPNIIPLLFTAGIMGYFDIPIKPSTILVFSIAFGISVDNTIHFLAKYRQELNATGWNIKKSVFLALRETGVSMLYTSTVLVFGFGIFAFSNYGGTQALGILVSITLLVALSSNLIILPSLLVGLEHFSTTKSFQEPLLQIYNEEEDIELEDLEIETPKNSKNENSDA